MTTTTLIDRARDMLCDATASDATPEATAALVAACHASEHARAAVIADLARRQARLAGVLAAVA